jgi:hypothetical protein
MSLASDVYGKPMTQREARRALNTKQSRHQPASSRSDYRKDETKVINSSTETKQQ